MGVILEEKRCYRTELINPLWRIYQSKMYATVKNQYPVRFYLCARTELANKYFAQNMTHHVSCCALSTDN